MRILQIDKFLAGAGGVTGGTSRYIDTLSDALSARGHEVLSFGCTRDPAETHLPRFEDFTGRRCPLAWLRMVHNRQAARLLDDFLQTNPVDVAHLHNIYHHLTTSILPILRRHGVATVMTVHDCRQMLGERVFWRWREHEGNDDWATPYRRAARRYCAGPSGLALRARLTVERSLNRYKSIMQFCCPSKHMADLLAGAGVLAPRLAVVPNFVLPPKVDPAARPDPKRVLYAGRLSIEKGPELMLALAASRPDVQVAIAGEGPEAERLAAETTARRLANIEWLGQLDEEGLAEQYEQAAVVAVPSRCLENSPASMLEAMWVGRAVVAPDQPSLREWINDAESGRLFPTGSSSRFLLAVNSLIDSPDIRERIALAGQDTVRRRHRSEPLVEQIVAIYEEARALCGSR